MTAFDRWVFHLGFERKGGRKWWVVMVGMVAVPAPAAVLDSPETMAGGEFVYVWLS